VGGTKNGSHAVRGNLGAEIRGVDLKEALDEEAHQTIHTG